MTESEVLKSMKTRADAFVKKQAWVALDPIKFLFRAFLAGFRV